MPPKNAEEFKKRVEAALNRFENQPRWRHKKAAMTDRDYANSYAKKQIRAALKSA
jgi:hypothetical protein